MADDTDVLLELWRGQRDEARQMENQRAALTSVVIVVAAAGFGFLAQHGGLRTSSLGVTLPMFVLGAFGAVACAKYGERWAVHSGLADSLRREVGLRHPGLNLSDLIADNRHEHWAEFPRISRVKIWVLWVGIHLGISSGGLVLSLWALVSNR
ncbi:MULTISPECIES: hypothetical protein [Streptomyces]|nr:MULTISPECIES: hypothetical protein [Streptomyces]QIB47735.1 hypothetical protein G3H79_36300 [Streptomyces aureoverticillatus]